MQNQLNIWKWIRHQLNIQGLNLNKLASLYGCHRQCFTNLKSKHCPKFEKILANILGLEPQQIWPDRYQSFVSPVGKKIKDD